MEQPGEHHPSGDNLIGHGHRRRRFQERFNEAGTSRLTIFTLMATTGIIAVWRGLWLLLDLYLFPANPLLSAGVSIAAGLVLVLLADYSLEDIGK